MKKSFGSECGPNELLTNKRKKNMNTDSRAAMEALKKTRSSNYSFRVKVKNDTSKMQRRRYMVSKKAPNIEPWLPSLFLFKICAMFLHNLFNALFT